MAAPISAGVSNSGSRAAAATGGGDGDEVVVAAVVIGAVLFPPLPQPAIRPARPTKAAANASRCKAPSPPCRLRTEVRRKAARRPSPVLRKPLTQVALGLLEVAHPLVRHLYQLADVLHQLAH